VHDEKNGLLVPPGDAAAFAGAIERMADERLRARLAANIARDNRDSDTQIRERLLAIYDA
jgi:glycosyltransferase involved in cell wall biosynthesis